ncbi:MAG: PAS domain S-box protein [Bacillota bacterium]
MKENSDITDRIESLCQAADKMIACGLWICNHRGEVEYLNASLLDMLGLSLDECVRLGLTNNDSYRSESNSYLINCNICPDKLKHMDSARETSGIYNTIKSRGIPIRDARGDITVWVGTCLEATELNNLKSELRNCRDKIIETTKQLKEFQLYNERLSIANDRLASFNMELTTANGKLSASNTKLMATIEKLRTDNYLNMQNIDRLSVTDEMFHSIFENSLDGIIFGYPDGTIVTANPAACNLFDRTLEELQEVGITGIVDLCDPESNNLLFEFDYDNGFNNEITLVRKDGSKFPGKVACNLYKGKDGRTLSCFIIHDLTQLKMKEKEIDNSKGQKNNIKALSMSEKRFSKIFEANPAAMCIRRLCDGRFVCVNKGFEKMTGYTRDEAVNSVFSQLFPGLDPAHENAALERIKRDGMTNNMELKLQRKTGDQIDILFSAETINFNGDEFLLATAIDITEKKRLEEELVRLDRLNLLGHLAASIGHEIRNPLTTVRGFLQLFRAKSGHNDDNIHFDLMIEELDRANSIITDFLSIAKNKPDNLVRKNINAIIETLLPLITSDAMNSGMNFSTQLNDVPDVLLNENEIRQLILNLVRNGLEAMDEGGNLTIKTFMDDDGAVVLSVRDQGKGITPENQKKLGTPFFTTKDKGTGLGLATSYSIAARNNATIDIETGPGGTTFFVRFSNISIKSTPLTLVKEPALK